MEQINKICLSALKKRLFQSVGLLPENTLCYQVSVT